MEEKNLYNETRDIIEELLNYENCCNECFFAKLGAIVDALTNNVDKEMLTEMINESFKTNSEIEDEENNEWLKKNLNKN